MISLSLCISLSFSLFFPFPCPFSFLFFRYLFVSFSFAPPYMPSPVYKLTFLFKLLPPLPPPRVFVTAVLILVLLHILRWRQYLSSLLSVRSYPDSVQLVHTLHCKKNVCGFPVTSRDVIYQTLPGREQFKESLVSAAPGEFGKWHPGWGSGKPLIIFNSVRV